VVAPLLVEVSPRGIDPEVVKHRGERRSRSLAEHLARDHEYLAPIEVIEKGCDLEAVPARPEVAVVQRQITFSARPIPAAQSVLLKLSVRLT
jgi:hypothetical protein